MPLDTVGVARYKEPSLFNGHESQSYFNYKFAALHRQW